MTSTNDNVRVNTQKIEKISMLRISSGRGWILPHIKVLL
jgi:hypothetical protein